MEKNNFIIFCFPLLLLLSTGCSTQQIITSASEAEVISPLMTVTGSNDSDLVLECSESLSKQEAEIEIIKRFLKQHVIEFHPDGYNLDKDFKFVCGELDTSINPDLVNRMIEETDKDIVFIYHGGLVGRIAGMKAAIESYLAMSKDGDYLDEHYPVFINWRTGGLDAYIDQTFQIRNGKRSPKLAAATSPFVIMSDLGKGISNTLSSASLESYRLIHSGVGDKMNTCVSSPRGSKLSPQVVCHGVNTSRETYPKGINKAGYFLTMPVRLVSAPLVNGLGESGWNNLVRRTRNLIWNESSDHKCHENCLRKGGLYTFFEKIRGVKNSQSISMIGHSMGTMLITDIIQNFPNLNYKNIVFMGAAVSIREFKSTVETLITVNSVNKYSTENIRFYNLSLFPTAEARELTAYGSVPSGSLLDYIDEVYEEPPSRLDKTLGKWANVKAVMNTFPEAAYPYMTFKVFGLSDTDPKRHGDFNDPDKKYWNESFWIN